MLNTISWLEQLEELEPGGETRQILEQIRSENHRGIKMCKKFARRRELRAGIYSPTPVPIDLVEVICQSAKRLNVSIDVVHEEFPKLLMADEDLVELVSENVIHNAQQHGPPGGEIQIKLRADSKTVVLAVTNKPGPNHDRNLALQVERGENSMIRDCASNVQYRNQIGCNNSTFRGLPETKRAAHTMGACANLDFQPDSVEFSLVMQMVLPANKAVITELPTSEPKPAPLLADELQSSVLPVNESAHLSEIENEPTPLELPEDTVLVCADDDKVSRMMFKMILRLPGLHADQINSKILGETLEEAQGLAQTVMDIVARVGEQRVLCIFDQMMDYETGMVLGTDVIMELRNLGFKGTVLIRSANDDHFARQLYLDAGASGFLSKSLRRGPAITESIVTQWYNAS